MCTGVYSMSVYVRLREEVHNCVSCVSNKGDKIVLLHEIRAVNLLDGTIIVNDTVSRVYTLCA